ncbi:acetate uptake transporter family protein [Micromonospora sp. NBC_01796]|uniref:acetate uptake transporter family protein n=1 Tax=Micromonospora sp. NBC_01796 TaxID=2975987 RepID=UPI002DDBB1CC|nr:GPR1/FUN34/YaaH family transporter [Micromonospora sp. NBC_01796]WSA86844.1 GPR1/FUN34/YaaH family transporter [Micromonospora sp. NBC_01796]
MSHMSRPAQPMRGNDGHDGHDGHDGEFQFWRNHATISLQPVAAPSILGLFGFAAATFVVGANLAGWYGNSTTPQFLFPFAAFLGGLAQLLAGMWAYRARDGLATAMHGIWGAFWLAYGLLFLLISIGVLTQPTPFVALGYWFVALAAITWSGAAAALAVNLGLAGVLIALAGGATTFGVGQIADSSAWRTTGAWFFVVSALIAWYVATAMMLEGTYRRVILPLGKRGGVNVPGREPRQSIQFVAGEPGIKVGQ